MNYKDSFRVLSKRLLKQMSKNEKEQYISDITNHLLTTEWWNNAKVIAITIPRDLELDTNVIIDMAWRHHKIVAIPKCFPQKDNTMEFYQYTNVNELENVYLDLYEPKDSPKNLLTPDEIDLIIVPGLLFDFQGYRIGYGGGYYDRYLKRYFNKKISIATEQQLIKHLPHDSYDIPVDAIITNKEIYYTNCIK